MTSLHLTNQQRHAVAALLAQTYGAITLAAEGADIVVGLHDRTVVIDENGREVSA